ncbi:MAG: FAD-dependent oxidoreductase [Chloroflexota bacterium]
MKSTQPFPHIFSPLKLGGIALPNRLVMAPMTTRYSDANGGSTDQLRAFYARRAMGGVGLIVFEAAYVEQRGKHSAANVAGIHQDSLVPGYRELTKAVHAYGVPIFMQLAHSGARGFSSVTGMKPVGPSPVDLRYEEVPQELSIEEITEIVEAFAQATRRAREAGFDGVELHGAHGYLLAEFLSPAYNKRHDRYGGDILGRTRIITEIVKRIQEVAEKDFPVTVRLVAQESYNGGLSVQDSIENARIIQKTGVAAIHLSAPRGPRGLPEAGMVRGRWAPLAQAFKKALEVPVITVGAITHPRMAEDILKHGHSDLVAMGRPLLCDPDLPRKAAAGKVKELVECTLCNMCHHTRPKVNCIINFECGREYLAEYRLTPPAQLKKVMVIGGGPAGMEAARVAALRGHRVTLYEQSSELGGQLRLATLAPHNDHLNEVLERLFQGIRRSKARVRLGAKVSPQMVKREKPDVVILASGSTPRLPRIPSANGDGGPNVVTAHQALARTATVGKYVVVVGSAIAAAHAAEVLVLEGKGVSLIAGAEGTAQNMQWLYREALLERLVEENVILYTPAKLIKTRGRDAIIRRLVPKKGLKFGIEEQLIRGVDTIVLGGGGKPNNSLASRIRRLVTELHVIGDAAKVGDAMDAIHHASQVARSI